jgi:nitrite reductase (NO-forming)
MTIFKLKKIFKVLPLFLIAGYLNETMASAEVAKLTTAPNVPTSIKRSKAETVVVNLEAKEYVGNLTKNIKYGFWSFGGTVPGPMARLRVGDSIEFHFSNAKGNILNLIILIYTP